MAQATWEKDQLSAESVQTKNKSERLKFLVGGVLILGAVLYLIISGTATSAQYFITVDDVLTNDKYARQTVRISGAVRGDTIVYDSENLIIEFNMSNIPTEFDDLAKALYDSVNDPNASRIAIRIENQVMPDLLRHEAQAIVTGTLGADGVFHATELLLKCPSRYQEAVPDQIASAS